MHDPTSHRQPIVTNFWIACIQKLRLCLRLIAIRFLHSFLPEQDIVAVEAATDNTNNLLSIAHERHSVFIDVVSDMKSYT